MSARTVAYVGMCRTASMMADAHRSDPVSHADLRTSLNDYRALLSQAIDEPCDRNGFALPLEATPPG